MSADSGRPRPFLTGVFKTACNYCVRCGTIFIGVGWVGLGFA